MSGKRAVQIGGTTAADGESADEETVNAPGAENDDKFKVTHAWQSNNAFICAAALGCASVDELHGLVSFFLTSRPFEVSAS